MTRKDGIPPLSDNPTYPAMPGHFAHGNYIHQEWKFIDTERDNMDLELVLGPDVNPGPGPLLQAKVWQPYDMDTACTAVLYECHIGGNGKGLWAINVPAGYPNMRAGPFGYGRASNKSRYTCGPQTAMLRFAWVIVTGNWNHEARDLPPMDSPVRREYMQLVEDVSQQLLQGYNNANGIKRSVSRYLNKSIEAERYDRTRRSY